MSIAKPFTFVANTYAKASEVNANFDTVYSQVNSNISAISQNAVDIENLENNKADINGNTAQRFAVADAITDSDAINKRTLRASIANSIDYISGFIITKDSGSPNNTIIVSEGSCYDSTKTVVLNKTNSSTKTNDNQAANATYYVYVIGNDSGTSVDVLISSSAVTPALPEGYTKFRQIGNYTTNSSNNINFINYYGNEQPGTNNPSTIVETYINGKSWYRISGDGWCEQGGMVSYGGNIGGGEETLPVEVYFIKSFINADYTFLSTSDRDEILTSGKNRTSSKIGIVFKNTWVNNSSTGSHNAYWYACGYIK